jgi:SAM-dependent methyltransferase
MFGAMFAPRPEVVASELARVLEPGGQLAMANWNPAGFTGQMFKASSRHVPPPPGIVPPVLWGDEKTVRERLEPHFKDINTELVPIEFDLPMNPAGAVAFFRQYFGPTKVAFSRLDEAGQAVFAADLEALWASANVAEDPESHTLIHNEYLRVTATRR